MAESSTPDPMASGSFRKVIGPVAPHVPTAQAPAPSGPVKSILSNTQVRQELSVPLATYSHWQPARFVTDCSSGND